jgi:hypothetical protein
LTAQGINVKEKTKIQLVLAKWVSNNKKKTKNNENEIQDERKQQSA